MSQKEQVVEALERNGGSATFSDLYRLVDTSAWKTKTPAASIRGIVQGYPDLFYKIMPGLWGLVSMRKQNDSAGVTSKSSEYTHAYYQGLLVEIGNIKNFKTYIPPQDKNKMFSTAKKLGDITTLDKMFDFTHEKNMRKAKTVDTVWFNLRDMPQAFFEVEHTTDIRNSLDKFFELQDFHALFRIVSSIKNKKRFDDLMSYSNYKELVNRVEFYDYDRLVKLHGATLTAAENAI